MAYIAVLDACVLHPMQLCDTLLRLADAGFYRPVWSPSILHEMETSIIRRGYPAEAIRARRVAMEEVFPDALESAGERFIRAVPGAVDAEDRHVVAAAIASHADVIVTANVTDFPHEPLAELGIAIQTPDEFLANQARLAPDIAVRVLGEQAAELQHPPMTLDELLASMERSYPSFVATVRQASA